MRESRGSPDTVRRGAEILFARARSDVVALPGQLLRRLRPATASTPRAADPFSSQCLRPASPQPSLRLLASSSCVSLPWAPEQLRDNEEEEEAEAHGKSGQQEARGEKEVASAHSRRRSAAARSRRRAASLRPRPRPLQPRLPLPPHQHQRQQHQRARPRRRPSSPCRRRPKARCSRA